MTQADLEPSRGIVHLVDVAKGTLLAEQSLDFYPPNFHFTPDGSGIMLFGTNAGTNTKSHVALLDATTLKIVWQEEVKGLLNEQVMKEGSTDWLDGSW